MEKTISSKRRNLIVQAILLTGTFLDLIIIYFLYQNIVCNDPDTYVQAYAMSALGLVTSIQYILLNRVKKCLVLDDEK